MSDPRPLRLRSVEHPVRALMFVLCAVLSAAAAFGLGFMVRSPDAAVLAARTSTVPAFAAVESRLVTANIRVYGDVTPSQKRVLNVGPIAGAERIVVTRGAAPLGPVASGALLGVVSNRPIFLLSLRIPLFRSLVSGDTGADVTSLQAALGVRESGKVDADTLKAVRKKYANIGILPPGGLEDTVISTAEFYSVSASQCEYSVLAAADIGTVIDEEHPFMVLSAGNPEVRVRASVAEAEKIRLNDTVTLIGATGRNSPGTVTAISEFQDATTVSGRPPGRDILIGFPSDADLAAGAGVTVVFGSEEAPDVAVPSIGIRSDGLGSFVLKREEGKDPVRVTVNVLRTADGWSAIESADLHLGEEILVSG